MRRLLARLAGLFVPKPPPKEDLTPRRVFVENEKQLAHLSAELEFYKLKKKP